jgi:hypothetical protein
MTRAAPAILSLALLLFAATDTRAQLRPLDSTDWPMVLRGDAVSAWFGIGAFADQRASLAGTRGTLLELGNFALGWKTGRVLLEASGTMVRRFKDREVLDDPFEYVVDRPDGIRQDAGDMRVATIVRLSPADWTSFAGLRFGTRLPTTDNRLGLDRDATDFFALLIGRVHRGAFAVAGEAGVSINYTRFPTYEQEDVLAYAASAEYAAPGVTLHAALVGQDDLHDRVIRGNENLSEARLGARVGRDRWLQVQLVHGLAEFSPSRGVLVSSGARFGNQGR